MQNAGSAWISIFCPLGSRTRVHCMGRELLRQRPDEGSPHGLVDCAFIGARALSPGSRVPAPEPRKASDVARPLFTNRANTRMSPTGDIAILCLGNVNL